MVALRGQPAERACGGGGDRHVEERRVLDAEVRRRRVLVVDDEARIREVVHYALERDGYAVETAADGRAALDRIDRGGIELVVLDVSIPEVDGLEVCRVARRKDGP